MKNAGDATTRPTASAPDHQTDVPIASVHTTHDLRNEGDSISCRLCPMRVSKPKNYNDDIHIAYDAWDKELR